MLPHTPTTHPIQNHPFPLRLPQASRTLPERIADCAPDRLTALFCEMLQADPDNIRAILPIYRETRDPERKESLFRALRTACANTPAVFRVDRGELTAAPGYRERLNIIALPFGRRQGAGLLTDFHLVSQLSLAPLGHIRALPLPAKFPRRDWKLHRLCTFAASSNELFRSEDFEATQFGRSRRFRAISTNIIGDTRYVSAVKPSRSKEDRDCASLNYEAAVMDYLRNHAQYFDLESELPSPSRGPRNSVSAWNLDGLPNLMYAASPAYFNYIDELPDVVSLTNAGLRVTRDLMRLARFGIFHTEPAPIFHSTEQKRRFLWNVGGLLPGAGDLEWWAESFSHSNLRQSGIADFEHFERISRMPATVSIVNDTEQGSALGFQYHLGNILFCAIHVMALGYHRQGTTFADHPQQFQAIFLEAFRTFCGKDWTTYSIDVDEDAVLSELSTLGSTPHVGEFAGAYPHQNFIKALYAFTLRAIPTFVAERTRIRASLPAPRTKPFTSAQIALSVPEFAKEIEQALEEVENSAPIVTLEEAGLPRNLRHSLVGMLRLQDIKRVQFAEESQPSCIAIRASPLLRSLRKVLPMEFADAIAERVRPCRFNQHDPEHSLLVLAKNPNYWLF